MKILINILFVICLLMSEIASLEKRAIGNTNSSQNCVRYSSRLVQCPAINPQVILLFNPIKKILIHCKSESVSYIELIPKFKQKNDISSIQVKSCRLPGHGFTEMLDKLNIISELESFYFKDKHMLHEIGSENLRGLESVEDLHIHVKTKSLHVNVFQNLTRLRNLELRMNLERLPAGIFNSLPHLETLDLSYNRLKTLPLKMFQKQVNLSSLILRYNLIKDIKKIHLSSITTLKYLDLSSNKIQTINNPQIFADLSSLKLLNLNFNPINCDCGIFSLLKLQNKNIKLNIDELNCGSPDHLRNRRVPSLDPHEFLCPLEGCPEKCSCKQQLDQLMIVNCSNLGLTKFSTNLAENFDQNFAMEIHIENNQITDLQQVFSSHKNIRKIFAAGNLISKINFSEIPESLSVLELHNNRIEKIVETDAKQFLSLDRLTLGMNPWRCDCDSLPILKFVKKNYEKIPDYKEIRCSYNNSTLHSLQPEDVCKSKKILYILGGCGLALAGILMGIYLYMEIRPEEESPESTEKPSFFLGSTNLNDKELVKI